MVYAHFRKLPCAHRSSLLGDGSWIYYRNLALLSRFPFSFVLLVSNIAVSLQWNWRVRESPFAYGALHSESMDCFWEPSSLGSHTKDEGRDLTSQQNSLRSPWKSAKDSKRTAIRVPMQKEDAQQANLVHRTNKLRLSQGPTLFHQENSSIPQSPYTGCRTGIRLFSVGWEVPNSFFSRGTVCKGRVSKSSPEMRVRGSVSTGFSSRSCPLFTEVVRKGIL